jgi:drug/metabolite transporter (DMT)-like permease
VTERPRRDAADTRQAKLLLVLLSFAWGLTWPVMKIVLAELTPWTMRLIGYGVGALFMFWLVRLRGGRHAVPFGPMWGHIAVSAVLNVTAFGVLTAFAQLTALTSRVVIVSYSMPVWASLLAWLVLGERPDRMSLVGLVLCVCGLSVLVYPLSALGVPSGLLLAWGAALSWAAGTVYLKWARLQGNLIAVTAWQLLLSFFFIAACVPVFEGVPHLWPLQWQTIVAVTYLAVVGVGLAHFLWFDIIGRLPAATASLGTLCVPVIGILSSVLILGERPTASDAVGFTLIFAAAACVLVVPSLRKG